MEGQREGGEGADAMDSKHATAWASDTLDAIYLRSFLHVLYLVHVHRRPLRPGCQTGTYQLPKPTTCLLTVEHCCENNDLLGVADDSSCVDWRGGSLVSCRYHVAIMS